MLFKKKPTPDENDLAVFKREAQKLEEIESGLNTQFGKRILELIGEYKSRAIQEFTIKDISEYGDLELLAWFLSIRGKLQLLNDFERQLLSAKDKREEIVREVNKYSA